MRRSNEAKSVVYASSLPVIGVPQELPITEDHVTKPNHPTTSANSVARSRARQSGASRGSVLRLCGLLRRMGRDVGRCASCDL